MTEANVARARVRVTRTDENKEGNKLVNTEIYEIANNISRYLAQPEVIEKVMQGRQWVQTMMRRTGLAASKVTEGAEDRMYNIVDLITFTPEYEGSTELEVISYIIKILKAHAEDLANDALYASLDIAIERLEKLEAEAVKNLKYSTPETPTSTASVVNHNTVYINNAGDANIDVSFPNQRFTGQQIGEFRKAIIGGFTESELKIALSESDLVNYDHQVSGDCYATRVFNLLTRIISPSGNEERLLKVLFKVKPNSPYLKQFLDFICPPSGGNNYVQGDVVQGNQFISTQHNYL